MDILDQLMSHSSVRSFENKALPESLKAKLIQAAQAGSSSNFVQAFSIIEIKDPGKRQKIEKISNGMGHIETTGALYIFVADLYRNHELAKETTEDMRAFTSMESLIVSIVDTTIAAQNMAVYAESQGLGICYIGGIRNDLNRLKEMLDLPQYTFPLFALTVGYPTVKNEVKPRLLAEELLKVDSYGSPNRNVIASYDDKMNAYYQARSNNMKDGNWTKSVEAHYHVLRRPEVTDFLKRQGFEF